VVQTILSPHARWPGATSACPYTCCVRCWATASTSYLRACTPDRISDQGRQFIFIGAAARALPGSRRLGLLEHPALLLHPPGGGLWYFTNKTIVGDLLGGLVGVELTKKRLGITAAVATSWCFRCCWGWPLAGSVVTSVASQMALSASPRACRGALILATAAIATLLICAKSAFCCCSAGCSGCWGAPAAARWPPPAGRRFKLFLAGYRLFRLLVEFLKPTPALAGLGLTAIQWACVGGRALRLGCGCARAPASQMPCLKYISSRNFKLTSSCNRFLKLLPSSAMRNYYC